MIWDSDALEEIRRALCEIATLRAENKRLQAVVDAALAECREVINAPRVPEGERDVAENIFRILDGEVKPCPTCGGSGEVHISADDTRVAMDGDCPDCHGTGVDGEVKP
jgi:hypothetical protein